MKYRARQETWRMLTAYAKGRSGITRWEIDKYKSHYPKTVLKAIDNKKMLYNPCLVSSGHQKTQIIVFLLTKSRVCLNWNNLVDEWHNTSLSRLHFAIYSHCALYSSKNTRKNSRFMTTAALVSSNFLRKPSKSQKCEIKSWIMNDKSIKNEWPTGIKSDTATKFTQDNERGNDFYLKKIRACSRRQKTKRAWQISLGASTARCLWPRDVNVTAPWRLRFLSVWTALQDMKNRQAIPQTRHNKTQISKPINVKPAGGWTNGLHKMLRNTEVTRQVAFQVNFHTSCTVPNQALKIMPIQKPNRLERLLTVKRYKTHQRWITDYSPTSSTPILSKRVELQITVLNVS